MLLNCAYSTESTITITEPAMVELGVAKPADWGHYVRRLEWISIRPLAVYGES